VLKAVDLDREVLCEFSHLNVGVMLVASRSHDLIERPSDGAVFHKKSLGV
jgi:hypothetical protein